MSLAPGTRVAHYEVSILLGSGAMGEVWRATDTNLGRDVAVKVLPDEFTNDPERLARFEREARVLASLDHPRIATIHGFEDVGDSRLLVMQLAEGEDLSARLEQGPIPLDEALPIARQLADGLDAAHEGGVVHRDLKPANIKVDVAGNIKILDFGLAMAIESAASADVDITSAPTMAQATTQLGVVLGTAAYMSPEQARGTPVDKRTDIWAFGVVLWEMLSGRRLFGGDNVSDTIAAVLTTEPDLGALPKETPAAVERLIVRCLERDSRKRLRDIGEAALTLEKVIDGTSDDEIPTRPSVSSRSRRVAMAGWIVASALLVALISGTSDRESSASGETSPMTLEIVLTKDEVLSQSLGAAAVLSPDGARIAFVAGDSPNLAGTARASEVTSDSETHLFLRDLGRSTAEPLRRTEGAFSPFFSPDGEWIAFFADGELQKIASAGSSTPQTVCKAQDPRGGAWGKDDVIVFAPTTESALYRVSGKGGEPQPLTSLDENSGERSHRWPSFLPDGRRVVFSAQAHGQNYEDGTIKIVDTADGSTTEVHDGGAYPRVTPTGHLTWAREGSLFAAPFDLRSLRTTATGRVVLDSLMALTVDEAMDDGTAHYAFSANGRLLYRAGRPATRRSQLVFFDRDGTETSRRSEPGYYATPRLSPDGSSVALTILGRNTDIWIWEPDRDLRRRMTRHAASDQHVIWSADGSRIIFVSNRVEEGGQDLFWHSADGSGEPQHLVASANSLRIQATSLSHDQRTLFGQVLDDHLVWRIVAIPITDWTAGDLATVISEPSGAFNGEISPDGGWLAYQGSDGEGPQVYLQTYPDAGRRWQISTRSGTFPRWTRRGREVIYMETTGRLVAVALDTSQRSPKIGRPELLFETAPVEQTQLSFYDVSRDGNTFVVAVAEDDSDAGKSQTMLVTNWFEKLSAAVPVE